MQPRCDDAQRSASELIEHILTRYHETHRRELPAIVGLARHLRSQDARADLADHLGSMAKALELHMFKEAMRLFPMMEQGGNSLIVHLIDDMEAAHLAQCDEMARALALLADLSAHAGTETAVERRALEAAVAKLFDDLVEHMRFEDKVLCPGYRLNGER